MISKNFSYVLTFLIVSISDLGTVEVGFQATTNCHARCSDRAHSYKTDPLLSMSYWRVPVAMVGKEYPFTRPDRQKISISKHLSFIAFWTNTEKYPTLENKSRRGRHIDSIAPPKYNLRQNKIWQNSEFSSASVQIIPLPVFFTIYHTTLEMCW